MSGGGKRGTHLRIVHLCQLEDLGERKHDFYLEEGEVPVTLNLSDLQVSHDDLTAVVSVLSQVVLGLLRTCGAQSVLCTGTHH